MLTLDTNILIAYLGGEEKVITQIKMWRDEGLVLFVSTVTECEILSYPKLSPNEEEKINVFLKENFVVIPFDSILARVAAEIRRIQPRLKLPDAAIASLAIRMNTQLVTRNVSDFKRVLDLSLLTI